MYSLLALATLAILPISEAAGMCPILPPAAVTVWVTAPPAPQNSTVPLISVPEAAADPVTPTVEAEPVASTSAASSSVDWPAASSADPVTTSVGTTTSVDPPATSAADPATTSVDPPTTSVDPPATTSADPPATTTSIAAPLVAVAPQNKQLDSFASTVLDYHNQGRAAHHVDPLTWDQDLADYAASVIAKQTQSCNIAHSGGPYGENVAMGYGDFYTGMHVWYNEGALYDYSNPQFSESTGHFTQMVWAGSKQLGCAYGQCASGKRIVFCEYQPRGNIYQAMAENVFPE